jgi:hypothetical protein
LYLRLASKNTSRLNPTVAMAASLVLCLVALVLNSAEAWAKEQPSQTPLQQGTVHSTTPISDKVAEPVPGAKTPPVVPPPVELPPAEDPVPPPPKTETPPTTEEPSPLPPTPETPPPAEEPSPPPIDPVPSRPEPEVVAPQPVPHWVTVVTGGEVVESEPVPTSQSVTDFGRVLEPQLMTNASPAIVDSASAVPAAPAATDDGYASEPSPEAPVLPVLRVPEAAPEQVLPSASGLVGLVRGIVAEPALPPATPQGYGGPLPTLATTAPVEGSTPSTAPVPTVVTASVEAALRLPSSLGATAASAVGTVQSAAASVASATAEVLRSLASGSPDTSSTDETQEQQPSEGTPQPAPAPLAPPLGGSLFSLSTIGGNAGLGGSFTPLLVGSLALLGTVLLRRDFRMYLASCDLPKPSSALLLPLERPG